MRRGVTLGAAILRGCAATAFVAGAVAQPPPEPAPPQASQQASRAVGSTPPRQSLAQAPELWPRPFVRSADESAALLGLDKAASIPMASATANTGREILQVICRSPCFLRRANPGACADYAVSAFGKLSPAKHRRIAA